MKRIGKLYNYYLKKNIWSWRLWLSIALCWLWWGVGIWASKSQMDSLGKDEIVEIDGKSLSREESKSLKEEFLGFKNLVHKTYNGALLIDDKSVEWWKDKADKTSDQTKKSLYTKIKLYFEKVVKEKKGKDNEKEPKLKLTLNEEEVEYVKCAYGGGIDFDSVDSNSKGVLTPLARSFTEFAAGRRKGSSMGFWKLIHLLSSSHLIGSISGVLLAYNLIYSLFISAKKSGEDTTVLNFCFSVERNELFFAKSLAYISILGIFSFLGLIIPYSIPLFISGMPWGAFSLLLLYASVITPILFFLFPASLYLFANNFGSIGTILYYLLMSFSLSWLLIRGLLLKILGENFVWFIRGEYWYYHPLFNIALAVVLGSLFLYSYYSHYQQEDLN